MAASDAPCGPGTCDGCCLFGACVEAASGCHGSDCSACLTCGALTCSGCCANGACVATPDPSACGANGNACVACSPPDVCNAGKCAAALGRSCSSAPSWPACEGGTGCLIGLDGDVDPRTGGRVESYEEPRCWPSCADGRTCPSGFECVDAMTQGDRACVPTRAAHARWAVRRKSYVIPARRADGSEWPSRSFQVCLRAGGVEYCERVVRTGTIVTWDRDFAHAFTDDELAHLEAELWMLPKDTEAPSCEGECAAVDALHTELAAHTSAPVDARPPPIVRHADAALILAPGPHGATIGLQLEAELLP